MSNARATRPRLHHLAERVASAAALDGPAEAVAEKIRGAIPRGPVKDALSGTQLGQALHPFLTDLPIGTWTSAAVLDLVGGRDARPAAERLIATGIPPAAPPPPRGPDRRERPQRLGGHPAGQRPGPPRRRRPRGRERHGARALRGVVRGA